MDTKVQRQKALEYIYQHGRMTQKDADTIGIGRLSARIWDLKHIHNWDIPTVYEKNSHNNGRHAVYHMSARDYERMEAGD